MVIPRGKRFLMSEVPLYVCLKPWDTVRKNFFAGVLLSQGPFSTLSNRMYLLISLKKSTPLQKRQLDILISDSEQ